MKPISIVSYLVAFVVLSVGLGCEPQSHSPMMHMHAGIDDASDNDVIQVFDISKPSRYHLLLEGKPQTCGMRSGHVCLQPGQSIGLHSTRAHEETLVFLAGKGHAFIGPNEKPYEIGAGKVIYIPPHTLHNMKNTGTEPLEYIFCVAPIHENEDKEHD